jgi:hypothetical protein
MLVGEGRRKRSCLQQVYLLAYYLFDGAFAVNWTLIAYSLLSITLLSGLVLTLSFRSLLTQNMKSLLQESAEQAS